MSDRPEGGRRPTIRRFLLVRIVGICLISFTLFGGAAYLLIVRPAQDELAQVAMELSADRLEAEFRSTAAGARQFLAVLRDWVRLGDTDLQDPSDLVRVSISQLRNRPFLLNVLFARRDGIGLIVGKHGDGFLARLIDERGASGRQRWLLYDADGRPTGEETMARDYDPRLRPWFTGAARAGRDHAHWTDPYIFFETRDLGLTVASEVMLAPDAEPLVIGLDFTVRDISHLTRRFRLGRSGGITLLTEDGRVLGLPFVAAPSAAPGDRGGLLGRPGEMGLAAVERGLALWQQSGEAPEPVAFEVGGEPWIGRFRRLQLDNLGLVVAATVPRADFAIGSGRDAAVILALALGVLVLAYVLSRQMSRRFQRIVQELGAESARIGAMELDRPVRVRSRLDEIASLVDAQERMRLMLRAATSELEATVAARTRELADREALLRQILDTVPIGLSMVRHGNGVEPTVVMTNAAGAAMFGHRPEDLVGRPISDFWVRAEDRARYVALFREQSGVDGFEARMRRRDGGELWVSLTAVVTSYLGEAVVLAAFQDVSARKEAEAQIRRYADLIQRIADTAPAALFEARVAPPGADGRTVPALRFTFLSRSIEPILGVPAEDILRDPAERLRNADPDDRRRMLASADRFADMREASQDEFRVVVGGEERWVLRRCEAPRRDPDGGGTIVGFYIDITERRRSEETLRVEKLRTEEALRKLRETQAQLVQAEKLSALAGLVAGVAHEINTPVGITYTAASTLADETRRLKDMADAGTAKRSDVMRFLALAQETTALMETHCRNAADLIQSFKKVAVDQSSDDRRTFRLEPYLEEIVLSLRPQYRKAGHQVVVDCPADVTLDSYPGAVSQIVTNLIVNSTIHAFAEGVAGTMRLTARAIGEGWIELRYQDDGRGIPPENRARIFEPFFTTRRGQGGSGLGLHILHNLVVVKLGGQVRYEDTPGGGATFVMQLPTVARA